MPSAVILQLAGAHPSGALLRSRWWLHGDAPGPMAIAMAMSRHARRLFTRVQGSLIGPEALADLASGRRLTFDMQAPPSADLRAP
ncbi:hypothetical protein [Mesobacterium pallidum]|uniref:hypothetical protein n=1 Tax=Mesobacterium pallidum TaxID=2872037 RepID=UPI001EE1DF04|nr:hypothetical protein [Mesobacterium pallidum]